MRQVEPATGGGSIITRLVLMSAAIAAIVVVIAGLISYPLIRASALAQTQGTLGRLADLTAEALNRGSLERDLSTQGRARDRVLPRGLARILRAEQVRGFQILPGAGATLGLSDQQVSELLSGVPISTVARSGAEDLLIEGRPLIGGSALVLQQPVTVVGGTAQGALTRFLLSLAIGLLIAIPIGYLAARRLTRPLRAARDAAKEMTAGSRQVRLQPQGPVEIADIALALNELSTALANSELRQREFLLSVSHELRTPLTAVKGYAEALADGVIDAGDVPRTGATVAAEATRLDRLVTDLLDLARLGAVDFRINPTDIDVVELGQDAAAVWTDRCAREGVDFRFEVHPGIPGGNGQIWARTDPIRVRQVIDNLLENALRVSPAGSLIVLAVGAAGREVLVEVRDSGPGLSADDLAIAFEPGALYERYRGLRPVGTGLGLALVARLARGLGGTATVGTAEEGGARFTVRLPGQGHDQDLGSKS
jgi:two-component system OmpR family sensor kinase